MPKSISFKVPAADQKTGRITYEEKTGYVVRLSIGSVLHKFVLQLGGIDNKPEFLTHYASGIKMPASLNEMKLRSLVAWGTASTPLTDRAAARKLIESLVETHGADKINAKIAAAVKINK